MGLGCKSQLGEGARTRGLDNDVDRGQQHAKCCDVAVVAEIEGDALVPGVQQVEER